MFCRNCGKQVPDGNLFCVECGTKVEGAPAQTPAQAAAPSPVAAATPMATQAAAPVATTAGKPPKKKKTGLVVGIIILLILAAAAVGVFLYLNSDSKKFEQMLASAEELMDDEEYEDAAEILEEALEIKEDDEDAVEMLIEAYEAMAEAYEEDGKYSKAEKIYKKIEALTESDDDEDDDDDDRDDDDDDGRREPTETTAPIPESTPEPVVEDTVGKVLNIYCFNDEIIRRVRDHYPGYVEIDWTTGKIGDVTVKWNITPSADNAYQNYLDWRLLEQSDAAADDKIDMFLIEADYALKYVDSEYTLPISDLGITDADIADQYKYTQDVVTDYNGRLKALSWQGHPSVLIYNREIAKEVIGTDDPTVVQQYVKDWETFIATADMMKAAGYQMVSSVNDTYRTYAQNVSSPWVIDGRINIDANILKWVYDSKVLVDSGMAGTHGLWSDKWIAGFYPDGGAFCYFGPAWLVNYSMQADVEGSVGWNGGWGATEGPQAGFWGGTWICAATGTDNADLIKDIMLALTTDADIMQGIVIRDDDFVNNKNVMESFIYSDYASKILGGQNPMSVYSNNAQNLRLNYVTAYDMVCNEQFQNAMKSYFEGRATLDEALDLFYKNVMERYPELMK